MGCLRNQTAFILKIQRLRTTGIDTQLPFKSNEVMQMYLREENRHKEELRKAELEAQKRKEELEAQR